MESDEIRQDWLERSRRELQSGDAIGVLALVEAADRFVDRGVAHVLGELTELAQADPRFRQVECRAGCVFCCYGRVSVMPVEAVAIAAHLRRTLTSEQLSDLVERMGGHESQLETLPALERAVKRLPCPMLREGMCSIYSARPMACRRHHSTSRDACEQNLADPNQPVPTVPAFSDMVDPVIVGISEATNEQRLHSRALEFIPAVLILLQDNNATEEWLKGGEALDSAWDEEQERLASG